MCGLKNKCVSFKPNKVAAELPPLMVYTNTYFRAIYNLSKTFPSDKSLTFLPVIRLQLNCHHLA